MVEKKCKICGEWHSTRKIAMHYWNIHREKYKTYKGNEEEREIVEPITTESINQEEYVLEPSTDYTAINKVEQEKLKEISNEKKANQEKGTNSTAPATNRDETEVINEVFRPYNTVVKPDLFDDGEVINEWC